MQMAGVKPERTDMRVVYILEEKWQPHVHILANLLPAKRDWSLWLLLVEVANISRTFFSAVSFFP